MIVRARLIKLKTDDGLVESVDGVPLGREYLIDLSTRRRQQMYNIDVHRCHEKDIVDEYPSGRWLVLDMLEILGSP